VRKKKVNKGTPRTIDVKEWIRRLEATHGDAKQALEFSSPLELLVALILAAQCTDERVNQVTKPLFKKYRDAEAYARAAQETLEEEVRSTGFYRNKAKAIRTGCREIVDRFGGNVPEGVEDLVSLPGVGRKTANIVIGNAFGRPAIGVDTHVKRLARRLGFSEQTDPESRRISANSCRRRTGSGSAICSSSTAGESVRPGSPCATPAPGKISVQRSACKVRSGA